MGSPFLNLALTGILKAAVVPLPVGGEAELLLPAQQRFVEAFSANDRVAEMVTGAVDVVKVKGKSPGINPVVLTDGAGKSKLFLVFVPRPNR